MITPYSDPLSKKQPSRERRLKHGEYDKLIAANKESRVWYLAPIINIAIETCMRRGEILALEWDHIDFFRSTALLPETKNGRSRWVPLNGKALDILNDLEQRNDRVFPITDNAFRQAGQTAKTRQYLQSYFHDLRHEAISRLFESGLSIPQVMAISGHQTASQLFRYIQLQDF